MTRRSAFWTGALAMGFSLVIIYTIGGFFMVAFPPARIASMFITLTPGDLATLMIEAFGHWAIAGLAVAVTIATIAVGGFGGIYINKAMTDGSKVKRALGFSAAFVLVALALATVSPEGASITAALLYVVPALMFARMTSGVRLSLAFEPKIQGDQTPLDAIQRSRRRFLVRSVAAIGGLVIGGAAMLRFMGSKTPVDVDLVDADVAFIPPPEDANFPVVPGHSPEITPIADFYNVDINPFNKPRVDHESWLLKIHGLFDEPYELSYGQLQSQFEVVEMAHTLTCISNEVGGDLISTAIWRGVRLKDVLARGGLKQGIVDIVFKGAEGYTDSIPLAKALEETTLVVFGMNGEPLPREHGFPARIIVPGIYGMKNVKWLVEIEAVDNNYQGYWMVRGWSDVARVKTGSRIDVPFDNAVVPTSTRLAGVAWAGDRGILRVEISEDDGESWRPALLKRELSPVAWRLWSADLKQPSGVQDVLVRATDGDSDVQTRTRTRPHPDGASGWHTISFKVE
ncbi:MAG: molybdopterin-dependent oxidoreductase [Actinomycetota bacterium]